MSNDRGSILETVVIVAEDRAAARAWLSEGRRRGLEVVEEGAHCWDLGREGSGVGGGARNGHFHDDGDGDGGRGSSSDDDAIEADEVEIVSTQTSPAAARPAAPLSQLAKEPESTAAVASPSAGFLDFGSWWGDKPAADSSGVALMESDKGGGRSLGSSL